MDQGTVRCDYLEHSDFVESSLTGRCRRAALGSGGSGSNWRTTSSWKCPELTSVPVSASCPSANWAQSKAHLQAEELPQKHPQRHEREKYRRLVDQTGIQLEAGCGIDTTFHREGWTHAAPGDRNRLRGVYAAGQGAWRAVPSRGEGGRRVGVCPTLPSALKASKEACRSIQLGGITHAHFLSRNHSGHC